jgi:tetratricopeptide (TPR) repeat protein
MFVGRSSEVEQINASYRNAVDGKGSILFLTGEAGLGKTTLVHEWWSMLNRPGAEKLSLYAEAACSIPIGNISVGKLEALQPWADVIVEIERNLAEEKSTKKLDLKALIHDSAPAWAWALPVVGSVAHAVVETAQTIKEQKQGTERNLNATNQQQVFQQYVNFITKIAEARPLVILLDDVHWADTSSTNLLFYLSRQITTKRILVIATYRPDDVEADNEGKGHPILKVKNEILRYDAGKVIALTYLSDAAVKELLAKMFPGYAADTTFERWLLKISDGNSLFVTQFLKTLQEDGRLDDNGRFTSKYEEITIPNSALAVVEERTRRLDKDTRDLLRYATAEGEEFTSYVLSKLTEKKPLELLQQLRKAESAGAVRSIGSSRMFANQTTMIYGYSHSLFHKALYDSLYEQEKEILHRDCYGILKTEWDRLPEQDRPISLATKLLLHADKCGENLTAAEVALGAALSAWKKFAADEAMEMIANVKRVSVEIAGAAEKRKGDYLRAKALALQTNIDTFRSRYAEALETGRSALSLFRELHKDGEIVTTHIHIGTVFQKQSQYAEGEAEFAAALELARQSNDKKGEGDALNAMANILKDTGKYRESLALHEQSLAIRQTLDDKPALATSYNNIGAAYELVGDYDNALLCYQKSLDIYHVIDARHGMAMTLTNIGILNCWKGNIEKGLEYFHQSIDIHSSVGDRNSVATLWNNLSAAYGMRNDYDAALDSSMHALEIYEEINHPAGLAIALNNIGVIHQYKKEYDAALPYYTRCLEIRKSINDQWGVSASIFNIGCLHIATGRYDDAIAPLRQAQELREKIGDRPGLISVFLKLGEAEHLRGNLVEARTELERSYSLNNEVQQKSVEADIICQLGLLCITEGMQTDGEPRSKKWKEAVALLEKGVGMIKERGLNLATEYEAELERIRLLLK